VTEPRVSRPQTEPGYGIPESLDGTLTWDWARDRLTDSLIYWVATIHPAGRPHVSPMWGVWVDDAFWMEGGTGTRRARNLELNPEAVVTVERGRDAVIVEGRSERIFEIADDLRDRLVAGFAKYIEPYGYTVDPDGWAGGQIWRISPRKVLAWGHYPSDCTRWTFDG
jgi:hypothetical protein